jgi:hypothetical protein
MAIRRSTTSPVAAGTYADPITVAVGHVKDSEGKDTPDFKPGVKFYLPNLRKYFIVEDTCGDGDTPQVEPCHNLHKWTNPAPAGSEVWLDIWIDGAGSTPEAADQCAKDLTEVHDAIKDPAPNYAVAPGPVLGWKCSFQFGDTRVTQ